MDMSNIDSEPVSPQPEDAATVDLQNPSDQLAAVTSERDQLAASRAELQDLLLRRQADFDNFRKRMERERSEYIEYAAMEALRPLLTVLDDFERALKVETQDKEYAKGMELIYQRTLDAVKKMGLEPIDAAGKPFDPHIHHAVEMVNTDDVDDNTVLEAYQKGYNFKGRLMRPAMVKVGVRG